MGVFVPSAGGTTERVLAVGEASTTYEDGFLLEASENYIVFSDVISDPYNAFDGSGGSEGNSIYTIPKPGIYIVSYNFLTDGAEAATPGVVDIKMVGSDFGTSSLNGSATYKGFSNAFRFSGTKVLALAQGETVEIQIYFQGNGGESAPLTQNSIYNRWELFRLS